MVLQQGEEITIWGKASPKEEITGFFRGEIRKTKASNDVAPTRAPLVSKIFNHTEFKFTESNHK
mgnify:CR=1 FL=1